MEEGMFERESVIEHLKVTSILSTATSLRLTNLNSIFGC